MDFLDHFSDRHRQLLERAANTVFLDIGDILMTRGDPGGDLFYIQTGTLEVVDARAVPEVVIASLAPGLVVGELSFLDKAPRSADVRCANEATVLYWNRESLADLLGAESELGCLFYRTLAEMAAGRVRNTTSSAMAGALAYHKPSLDVGLVQVRNDARATAERVKDALVEAETRLRIDTTDPRSQIEVRAIFDRLQSELKPLFSTHANRQATQAAAQVLARELNPYLVRSALAERCIRRPQGVSGTAEIMALVLLNQSSGDGHVGELIDRWILDRPSLRAMAQFQTPLLQHLRNHLPAHRNRRVLLINAGTGSLIAKLIEKIKGKPTVLSVLDQSANALAYLDGGLYHKSVQIKPINIPFVPFALEKTNVHIAQQDAIIIQNMLEYLPDRIAISLLTVCAAHLSPQGTIYATGLKPHPDQDFLDHLLKWPTVRRHDEKMTRLFEGAGLTVVERLPVNEPGVAFVSKLSKDGPA